MQFLILTQIDKKRAYIKKASFSNKKWRKPLNFFKYIYIYIYLFNFINSAILCSSHIWIPNTFVTPYLYPYTQHFCLLLIYAILIEYCWAAVNLLHIPRLLLEPSGATSLLPDECVTLGYYLLLLYPLCMLHLWLKKLSIQSHTRIKV